MDLDLSEKEKNIKPKVSDNPHRRFVSHRASLTFAAIVLLSALSQDRALSADIQKMPYQYSSDMSIILPFDETFVLCDCKPAPPLSVKPQQEPISVRANEPFHFSVPPPPREESIGKSPEVMRLGNSDRAPVPGPITAGLQLGTVSPAIIRFGFNQVNLTPVQESEIANIAWRVKKDGGKVRVLGHTCDLGTTDRNVEISRDRAKRVAAIFKEQGVDVAEIEGKGSCCPLSTDRKLNRRVEIVVIKKGGDHEK